MAYINNYREPIELAQGATAATLSLPDGEYRLTLTNAEGNAWEIVDAVVASGSATLTRAVEGTSDQNWPTGSTIYCAVTAGQLNALAETGGSGAVVSDGPPTDAPPGAGAFHVSTMPGYERACVAISDRGPEDWLPLSVLPPLTGYEANSFATTYSIDRSAKEVNVFTPADQTGEFTATLTLPAWEASPLGFSVTIEPEPSASAVTRLDFSAMVQPGVMLQGEVRDFSSGATLGLDGHTLSVTSNTRVVLSRLSIFFEEGLLWFTADIGPAPVSPASIFLGEG